MNLLLSEKKQELLQDLLEEGMVLVAIDGRAPGVDIPDNLRGDPQVRLNLSYRFGLSMELDDWGVKATLTFGGMPHDCKIPWQAIFLVYSHASQEQFLFPADLPADLLGEEDEVSDEAAPTPPTHKGRPKLSLVRGGAAPELDEEAPGGVPEEGDPSERAPTEDLRPPYLRRIK